ncbi:MAG: NAD-dependent epimerase/dehydratase family protein, partial [Thermoflexales bacterium]|nr:NAD-dependent epimerase/dehydratase family protein [Thermoflexales bacterium]
MTRPRFSLEKLVLVVPIGRDYTRRRNFERRAEGAGRVKSGIAQGGNRMKVFITGGGGFIGSGLARAILSAGALADSDGTPRPVTQITLFDAAFPPTVDPRFECVTGDISSPQAVASALDRDTASVFHLAAVVSGGAEADFDLGMKVNLDGCRALLEACRNLARPPRFVFASSVAAFGGNLPDVLDDSTTPNPQTSYGAQKVVSEYLVTDYSRKGFIDGRSLRLPTIVVRPGKPNLAASSFASGIIREPLNGHVSECPVDMDTGVWLLSPGKVVENFLRAHDLPSSAWGANRVVNLPGISTSVREMVAAMGAIAGPT